MNFYRIAYCEWVCKLPHLNRNLIKLTKLELNRRFITVGIFIPYLKIHICKLESYFAGFAYACFEVTLNIDYLTPSYPSCMKNREV